MEEVKWTYFLKLVNGSYHVWEKLPSLETAISNVTHQHCVSHRSEHTAVPVSWHSTEQMVLNTKAVGAAVASCQYVYVLFSIARGLHFVSEKIKYFCHNRDF